MRSIRTMFARFVAGVLAATLVAACGDDGTTGQPDDTVPAPSATDGAGSESSDGETGDDAHGLTVLDGAWTAVEGTVAGEPVELPADAAVTLEIDSADISGVAACNSYHGTADFGADGSLQIGEVSSTEMGCVDTVVTAVERAFLGSLGDLDAWTLDRETLTLHGGDTDVDTEWVFEPVAPVEDVSLDDTTWRLDTFLDGDAATSSAAMAAAYLQFEPNGEVAGTTGCRPVAGTWSGGGIEPYTVELTVVDDPAAGVCAPESQELDDLVAPVLVEIVTAEIDGTRLTLASSAGSGLVYAAIPPADTSPDAGADAPTAESTAVAFDPPSATITAPGAADEPDAVDEPDAADAVLFRPVLVCSAIGDVAGDDVDGDVFTYPDLDQDCLLGLDGVADAILTSPATAVLTPETGTWAVQVDVDGSDSWRSLVQSCFDRTTDCPTGQIALVVDGVIVTAPLVQQPDIPDTIQISGDFDEVDARRLAAAIDGSASGIDGPVVVGSFVLGDVGEEALATGTLRVRDDGCLVIGPTGSAGTVVLWPFGTTWQEDSASVVMTSGDVVLVGFPVELAGGFHAVDGLAGWVDSPDVVAILARCAGDATDGVFVVQHPPSD